MKLTVHFPGIIFDAANMEQPRFSLQEFNLRKSIRASKSFKSDHQDHLILTSSPTGLFFVDNLLETIENTKSINNFPLKTYPKRMVLEHQVHVYLRLEGFFFVKLIMPLRF